MGSTIYSARKSENKEDLKIVSPEKVLLTWIVTSNNSVGTCERIIQEENGELGKIWGCQKSDKKYIDKNEEKRDILIGKKEQVNEKLKYFNLNKDNSFSKKIDGDNNQWIIGNSECTEKELKGDQIEVICTKKININ